MSKAAEKWVFFSALPPFRGGISKFSAHTLHALSKFKLVTSFTFRKQYPNFLFPGSSQFEQSVTSEPSERIVSTFHPLTYLTSLLRIRQERPAVFVTSYWMTFMAPMMAFWAFFLPRRTKKVAIIHNLVPHEKRFFDGVFNLIFLRSYDAFVVLSEAVRKDVLQLKPDAKVALLGALTCFNSLANAGIMLGGTRVLYTEPSKETSILVMNQGAQDIYPAMILVGMLSIGIIGFLMDRGLLWLEQRLLPWRVRLEL